MRVREKDDAIALELSREVVDEHFMFRNLDVVHIVVSAEIAEPCERHVCFPDLYDFGRKRFRPANSSLAVSVRPDTIDDPVDANTGCENEPHRSELREKRRPDDVFN